MALQPVWVYPVPMTEWDAPVTYLSAEDWDALQEALAAPPKVIPGLVELFRKYGKGWANE